MGNNKTMSDLASNIETLRIFRENNVRKSREVLNIWLHSIKDNVDKLGNKKHLILEQACVAALDCYNTKVAKECIKLLSEEFPKSLRVQKYEAMLYEANENYEAALKLLDKIIKIDDTNSAARKRKVVILKAQGKNSEAIKELADYLKIFMADVEAWQELSELYLSEQDYNKAAFCIEELILHNPHNHLLHQRYADIRYTQGGLENLELARAYYSQAVCLNEKNLRALYGLYLSTTAIANSQKCAAPKKKDALKTAESTMKLIKNHYSKYGSGENEDIESRLSALSIN